MLGLGASLSNAGAIESPSLVTNATSLNFDGSNDYIELGSQSGDLRLSGSNGTVSAWILLPDVSAGDDYKRIVDKSDAGSGENGYTMWVHTDGIAEFQIDAVAGSKVAITTAITDGVWVHLAATWDGTTVKIYRNAVLEGSATDSSQPPSDTTGMRIGSWNHSTGREFQGNIDEVAIWSSALTATEVEAIYDNVSLDFTKDSAGYASSSNLKGWWRMGDGQNTLDGDDIIFQNHTKTIIDSNITLGTTNLWATAGKSNMALGTSILNDAGDSYSAYNGWGTINGTVTAETDATDGNYIKYVGDGSGTTLAQLVTAHSAHAGKIYKSTFEYRCNYYVMFSNNGYVTDNVALPRTTDSAGDSISSGDAFKTAVVYFKGVSAYIGNFRISPDTNVSTNTPADAEFNYKNWTMYELSDNHLGTMTNMSNNDMESEVPS